MEACSHLFGKRIIFIWQANGVNHRRTHKTENHSHYLYSARGSLFFWVDIAFSNSRQNRAEQSRTAEQSSRAEQQIDQHSQTPHYWKDRQQGRYKCVSGSMA